MKDIRPFASLSSSLLARKGGARPAMRPNAGKSLDDLGWNDMGFEAAPEPAPQHHPIGLSPAPIAYQAAIQENFAKAEAPAAKPVIGVKAPKSRLRVAPKAKAKATIKVTTKLSAVDATTKAKSAFTLRLDTERHLRLRLACVVSNRSAQKLLIEALDAYLDTIPNIDELADHVPHHQATGQH